MSATIVWTMEAILKNFISIEQKQDSTYTYCHFLLQRKYHNHFI